MLDKERVAPAIFDRAQVGGRFAGEMGGEGNLAILREALRRRAEERGYPVPAEDPQLVSIARGIRARSMRRPASPPIDARLIERRDRSSIGLAEWVTTFRAGWLDRADVPAAERPEIGAAVADRIGTGIADYVRLRFMMRKPN